MGGVLLIILLENLASVQEDTVNYKAASIHISNVIICGNNLKLQSTGHHTWMYPGNWRHNQTVEHMGLA